MHFTDAQMLDYLKRNDWYIRRDPKGAKWIATHGGKSVQDSSKTELVRKAFQLAISG